MWTRGRGAEHREGTVRTDNGIILLHKYANAMSSAVKHLLRDPLLLIFPAPALDAFLWDKLV